MQAVIVGVGGQGVLLLARVLARAGGLAGLGALVGETHGMSQRGGSVAAFVKLGDYQGSLVREGAADVVLCLAAGEAAAGSAYCRPGGALCVDAPAADAIPAAVREFVPSCGATLHVVDAAGLAAAHGSARGANVALLGFASARCDALPAVSVLGRALDEAAPGAAERNRALFAAGRAAATVPVTGVPHG